LYHPSAASFSLFPPHTTTEGWLASRRAWCTVSARTAATRGVDRVHIYFARLERLTCGNYNAVASVVVTRL
jgi:hypothetical protein